MLAAVPHPSAAAALRKGGRPSPCAKPDSRGPHSLAPSEDCSEAERGKHEPGAVSAPNLKMAASTDLDDGSHATANGGSRSASHGTSGEGQYQGLLIRRYSGRLEEQIDGDEQEGVEDKEEQAAHL